MQIYISIYVGAYNENEANVWIRDKSNKYLP